MMGCHVPTRTMARYHYERANRWRAAATVGWFLAGVLGAGWAWGVPA